MTNEVRIPFTREANGYKYSDCLVLPSDHNLTEQEITDMQNTRFAEWFSHIDAMAKIETGEE